MECGAAIHFMRNRRWEKVIDASLQQPSVRHHQVAGGSCESVCNRWWGNFASMCVFAWRSAWLSGADLGRLRRHSIAMGTAHNELQWGKFLWTHLWIDHMCFFAKKWRILSKFSCFAIEGTPAGPHPRAPPLPTHPHGTGLRGIPQARHRRRSPRPRHAHPRPLLRPRPQARPGTVVAALDPHAALGAAEVGLGRALPRGPGPSAPQGVGGELPPSAGGGVDAAGRMGSHAGRCAPPPGSPPPQPPRAPGPPVRPQAPAGDPPGNAARRHPPVGHHPKPSPARTHPLTTPQASAHRHRRHPQHPRSPARHTTRRA